MALVHVEFDWSDEKGLCNECGLPAAWEVVDAYGEGHHMLACALCAAYEAAYGGNALRHLFAEVDI